MTELVFKQDYNAIAGVQPESRILPIIPLNTPNSHLFKRGDVVGYTVDTDDGYKRVRLGGVDYYFQPRNYFTEIWSINYK
jgi:hypothetical protein